MDLRQDIIILFVHAQIYIDGTHILKKNSHKMFRKRKSASSL